MGIELVWDLNEIGAGNTGIKCQRERLVCIKGGDSDEDRV